MKTIKRHRSRLAQQLERFWRNDEGIAVTEYGLLIALVAILLIGVVTIFASQISSWFSAKTSQITSV
jgi:pilus assembly protein Flp/PilA